jgi:hypothetical protein
MSLEGSNKSTSISAPHFYFSILSSWDDQSFLIVEDNVVDGTVLLFALGEESMTP